MIENLNDNKEDLVYTHVSKVGGYLTTYYSLEKSLVDVRGRIEYPLSGTWLKSYKDLQVPKIKRKAKQSFNALVLSVRALKSRDVIKYSIGGVEILEDMTIYYGQIRTPLKSVNNFQKHYVDVDISINKNEKLTSRLLEEYGEIDDNLVYPLNTEGENISEFLKRNTLPSIVTDKYIEPPVGVFKHFRGHNTSIINSPSYRPISCLETIKHKEYINLSDSCYSWREIIDGEVEELQHLTDRSMLLSMKTEINKENLVAWLNDNFVDIFDELSKVFDVLPVLDFNFIFHPPILTSMQYEGSISILSPKNGINTKVVDSFIIRVPKSLVLNSQKGLEVSIDVSSTRFNYSSFTSPELFSFIKDGVEQQFKIEDKGMIATFESIYDKELPDQSFKLEFKIPHNVLALISNTKYYYADVKLIDLTAERRE